ncbi:MAG: hypothetical protein IK149_01720 [Oscillospiraceae bacterium]|nr:hypothetical protein [Oscillospiraceae bacterium]
MGYKEILEKEKVQKPVTAGAEKVKTVADQTVQPKAEQMQAPSAQLMSNAEQQKQTSAAKTVQAAAPAETERAVKDVQAPAAAPAAAAAAQAQGQQTQPAAPTWDGGYQQEIDDLYAQITGRPTFRYNINEDEMWQSLKDDYRRMGQDAMRDTMGQAAGLTGGYGSSYSQAAGNAAYDKYMTQLSERAPELYDRAYQRYKDEGDEKRQQLSDLMKMDEIAYGRYGDEYNRWYQERAHDEERGDIDYERRWREDERDYDRRWQEDERDYDRRWQEDERDYGRQWQEDERAEERRRYEREYEDKRGDVDWERAQYEREYGDKRSDIDYEREQYEREYGDKRGDVEYQRQQEKRSYVMSLLQYGYTPTDEDLAAAGLTREQAEEMASLWSAENPDLAYRVGRITAEEYYAMTGEYPKGYQPEGTGGDKPWWYYLDTGDNGNGNDGNRNDGNNGTGVDPKRFEDMLAGATHGATGFYEEDLNALSPEQWEQLKAALSARK